MAADTTIDTLKLNIRVTSNGDEIKRVERLTSALGKLDTALERVGSHRTVDGVGAVGGEVAEIDSHSTSIADSTARANRNINFLGTISKLRIVAYSLKRIGNFVADIVQKGIDYTETLNLWKNSMRDNVTEARKFVNEMNRVYGFSDTTTMQYQATFKNMVASLGGLTENQSYMLSEFLVKLGADYASLYNITVSDAMSKFQAVLAGQIRPIRGISGYDVSKNTLSELYKQIGGDKPYSQLAETEKRLLRIYAVFVQMEKSQALHDMEDTFYQSANQLRIMKENAIQLATWVGVVADMLLQQSGILYKLNVFMAALAEAVKGYAYSLGYEEQEIGKEPLANWEAINEEIDEARSKLLGFDKFQVLQAGGAGESTSIFGIVKKMMEAYESMYSGKKLTMQEDVDKLLTSWNLVKQPIDEAGEQFVWVGSLIGDIVDGLEMALSLVLSIVAVNAADKLVAFVHTLGETSKGIANADKILATGFIMSLFMLIKGIKEGDKVMIAMASVALVALTAAFIALHREGIAAATKGMLDFAKSSTKAYAAAIEARHGIIPLEAALKGGLGLASAIPMFFLFNALLGELDEQGKQTASTILSIAGAVLALGAGISFLITKNPRALLGLGTGIGMFAAGIKGAIEVNKFADGGVAKTGTLFWAGEAGTEMVYKGSNSGTNVANVQQMEDAFYRALLRRDAATGGEGVNLYVKVVNNGGSSDIQAFREQANRQGYDLVRIK